MHSYAERKGMGLRLRVRETYGKWHEVYTAQLVYEHHFLQTTIIASMPIMVNKMVRIGSVT